MNDTWPWQQTNHVNRSGEHRALQDADLFIMRRLASAVHEGAMLVIFVGLNAEADTVIGHVKQIDLAGWTARAIPWRWCVCRYLVDRQTYGRQRTWTG